MSYCRHHPATNSRWHCTECELSFCDRCTYAPRAGTRPACLHCGEQLEFQPEGSDVVPFWQCLNVFFLYPFQLGPMALLGIAVFSGLLLSGGLLTGLLSIFVALLQIKYGFNVIAEMSEGEFRAPSLIQTITESGYSIVFKQFGVVMVMVALTGFVTVQLSPLLGIPLAIFFVLVLPMSTIVLANEHSLRAALDPIILAKTIYGIGWPYMLVYLYLLMMASSSAAFGSLAYQFFGLGVAQVITSASGYYFTLVMYALMGYMTYQYRHKLHFGMTTEDLSFTPDPNAEDPRVHVSLQQGEYRRAMDLLAGDWKEHRHPATAIDKYVKIARFSGAWDHVKKSLTSLLAELLKADSTQMIPRLLRDLLADDPEFEIGNPSLAVKVAGAVRERGDSKLAARLLMNQHKLTKDPEMQRRSIGALADILDDLKKPEVAAHYRALRDKIKVRPEPGSDGLTLADY